MMSSLLRPPLHSSRRLHCRIPQFTFDIPPVYVRLCIPNVILRYVPTSHANRGGRRRTLCCCCIPGWVRSMAVPTICSCAASIYRYMPTPSPKTNNAVYIVMAPQAGFPLRSPHCLPCHASPTPRNWRIKLALLSDKLSFRFLGWMVILLLLL